MNTNPVVICFRENYKNYFSSLGLDQSKFVVPGYDFQWCENFNELSRSITDDIDAIIFAPEMVTKYGSISEFMLMLNTMVKFSTCKKTPIIGVSVYKNTSMQEIKEFQKNGANGIFPSRSDFTEYDRKKAITELLEKRHYWPKHILDQLPGQKQKQSKLKDIQLTPRQTQVFELIANRGLSNKQIAQVLKIAESTVKIHVSAIMKAMCVRNRTQLALSVK